MTYVADPLAARAMDEVPRADPLTREDFVRQYLRPGKPVVVRVADDKAWSLASVVEALGDREVTALRTDAGHLNVSATTGVHFERIRLSEATGPLAEGVDPKWHVSVPLSDLPVAFTRQLPPPVYCADAPFRRPRVWLAAPGTVTPLHWDIPRNFLRVVFGHRRVLLYPPLDGLRLSPNLLTSKVPNFARINPEAPDYKAFRSARATHPVRCILGPGEALYIPPGWWHHVRSLDTSFAVSYWWGGLAIAAAWQVSLAFKGLRGSYRREWK